MWPRIRSVGDTRCVTGVGPSFVDLVVLKGTYARPSFTPDLGRDREASGSVGLLQRLAAQLCIGEGIHGSQHGIGKRRIAKGPSLEAAKQAVAEQMQGRFQTFADNFVRGMR